MISRTHRTVSVARTSAKGMLVLTSLLALGCVMAAAQESRAVRIPVSFPAEARDVRTAACLQVNEQVYTTQGAWWEDSAGSGTASEKAFKAAISAIKRKDRAALIGVSEVAGDKGAKQFDEQATAFFQQFENLEIVSVPRAYSFDGLSEFYVRLRTANNKLLFAPFIFSVHGDGSYKFLPTRTNKVSYQLVNRWFEEPWGPSGNDKPSYCSEEEVRRATHKVELAPSDVAKSHTSELYLTGAAFDHPGDEAAVVAKVKATVEEMRAALSAGKLDEFVRHMTPEGGNRLKQWFTAADENDRGRYKEAFTRQQPFFIFDESPLVVLYSKTADGTVQIMYFTPGAGNELLWTNSSHVTVADQVFKRGPLYKAAAEAKPFSSLAIK